MLNPQSGILPEANSNAVFVVLTIRNDDQSLSAIRNTCADIPQITRTLSEKYPDASLSSTVSIASSAWDALYPGLRPMGLTDFPAQKEGHREAPATPGDLLLHVRSNREDVNFILIKEILETFSGSVEIEEDVTGFRYLESRDLTGFVDGTENPSGDDRATVALVSEEDPVFAGGSYMHCQRYIHHLKEWEQQPVTEQETIIGRTKKDDIEFSAEEKSPVAHIKRVNLKDKQGKSMEILRHSMPYGNAREAGLFFIAYSKTPDHFTLMLESMIHADHHGHYDHLMNFTTAVTGGAFFAPSIEFLQNHR